MKEIQISREVHFKGKVIEVCVDEVSLPNGKTSTRECVLHNGAVAIMAIIDEHLVLVKQYRYVIGQETLELPAGKVDVGEQPYDAALREFEEETPYRATKLEQLYETYGAIGFSNERVVIYEAKGITKDSTLSLDEDEFVCVQLVSKQEAKALLETGQIIDAKTIIGILNWLSR